MGCCFSEPISKEVNVNTDCCCVQAVKCANALMDKVTSYNRRTLDMLAAKCYFYYSRAYELTKQLDTVRT